VGFIKITLVSLKIIIVLIVGICIGFLLGRYSLPKISVVDAKKIFRIEDNDIISNWPELNNKQMASYAKISGFDILAPLFGDNNSIIIMKRNIWGTIYRRTNDFMHQTNTGEYYSITEWDSDNKGVYDSVLYNTIDNNGIVTGMVIDLDRDGQPDIKVLSYRDNNGKTIVKEQYNWIDGNWYKRERINGNSMIKDGNKYRKAIKKGRRFMFLD
jgi:hypothetical protein